MTENKENRKLSNEELAQVNGGAGTTGYKYSFRRGDFIYMDDRKQMHMLVWQDLDTDDGSAIVEVTRENGSVHVILDTEKKSAKSLYHMYENFGGHLQALD